MPSSRRSSPTFTNVKSLSRRLFFGVAAIAGISLFSHSVRAANNRVPFVDIV